METDPLPEWWIICEKMESSLLQAKVKHCLFWALAAEITAYLEFAWGWKNPGIRVPSQQQRSSVIFVNFEKCNIASVCRYWDCAYMSLREACDVSIQAGRFPGCGGEWIWSGLLASSSGDPCAMEWKEWLLKWMESDVASMMQWQPQWDTVMADTNLGLEMVKMLAGLVQGE